MTSKHGPKRHFPVVVPAPSSLTSAQAAPPDLLYVTPTKDGIARGRQRGSLLGDLNRQPELVQALKLRGKASGALEHLLDIRDNLTPENVDRFASRVLVVPRSERWREAVTTASLGSWCEPFFNTGHLSTTALGALKAEARAVHRQLVPVWRRRTRHGRVLSLDAGLGDGLSLYDLVAADVDLLTHTTGGVFDDERLNTVLRGLNPAERAVVFAYAVSDARTWAEAATAAGATEPEAFGERVRRKTRRLAAEHTRRMSQRRGKALPVGGPSRPLTIDHEGRGTVNSRPAQGVVYPIHSLARSTQEERFTDMAIQFVTPTEDGVHAAYPDQLLGDTACASSDLVQALRLRGRATGVAEYITGDASVSLENCPAEVDSFTAGSLVLPCSKRWREAVTTALLGSWSDPLLNDGRLSHAAVGALKAEARAVHRQLVPVWSRGTRRGSVLSLDADLGDGLSLYDLVAADVDLLAHATGCVFEDARLNAVLRGLNETERRVVYAYAEGAGTTWAEAAAAADASDPHALGERVRRKAKRLAAEQRRRVEQRRA